MTSFGNFFSSRCTGNKINRERKMLSYKFPNGFNRDNSGSFAVTLLVLDLVVRLGIDVTIITLAFCQPY